MNPSVQYIIELKPAPAKIGEAVHSAHRTELGHMGKLVVGICRIAIYDMLQPVVRLSRERYSNVGLILSELPIQEQIQSFCVGTLIGIIRPPVCTT